MIELIWGFFLLARAWMAIAYTGPKMGIQNLCDDGQTVYPLYYEVPNVDPKADVVSHACMNQELLYNMTPPLRGNHRPNWAKYGEYLYVPPQRWLHNLEHGSVIMLYHPCSDPTEVNKLRYLVNACLYRHIITPYRQLSLKRPLALLTWGRKLEMNYVDVEASVAFIRENAHIAPEDLFKQGKYDLYLIEEAEIVTDQNDTAVCDWVDKSGASSSYLDNKQYDYPLSSEQSEREARQIGADANYDRIYMEQLRKSNGPKFANDVLPPSAILRQYSVPHYVMAGSFLGGDPRNPKTAPKPSTARIQRPYYAPHSTSTYYKTRPEQLYGSPRARGYYYGMVRGGGRAGPLPGGEKQTDGVQPTPQQLNKVLMRLVLQNMLENNHGTIQ